MRRSGGFIFLCLPALLSILAGCRNDVAHKLSEKDKSDIRAGVAFAEKRLPVDQFESKYGLFSKSGEFVGRSRYFKAGADYRALLLADQVRQMAAIDEMFTQIESVRNTDREKKERATVLCSSAWNEFHKDLQALLLTPDEFGKVVGNDDLGNMMSYDRYGFED